MIRTPVNSSNLASVGYDQERRTLEIEFRNGHLYRYLQVPPGVFADLMAAPSKGAFFTDGIKGRYPFEQLR